MWDMITYDGLRYVRALPNSIWFKIERKTSYQGYQHLQCCLHHHQHFLPWFYFWFLPFNIHLWSRWILNVKAISACESSCVKWQVKNYFIFYFHTSACVKISACVFRFYVLPTVSANDVHESRFICFILSSRATSDFLCLRIEHTFLFFHPRVQVTFPVFFFSRIFYFPILKCKQLLFSYYVSRISIYFFIWKCM